MVAHLAAGGMRLAANVKPYLLDSHPLYDAARRRGIFVRQRDGATSVRVPLWAGGAFAVGYGGCARCSLLNLLPSFLSSSSSLIDFTSDAGYEW